MDPAPPNTPDTDRTLTNFARTTVLKPFPAGSLIAGRFRIQHEIAEGGMGVVYFAIDEKLNQPRALKVAKLGYGNHLPPEARSALAVTHPNVCRVFEIHTTLTPRGTQPIRRRICTVTSARSRWATRC